MQNYPYIMPMYHPQGYRYQQPPVMQPQDNVDLVQVAGYEAAKAQQVLPGCVCWMRSGKRKLYNKKGKKKYPKKLNLLLTINQKGSTMGLPKRLKEVVMW